MQIQSQRPGGIGEQCAPCCLETEEQGVLHHLLCELVLLWMRFTRRLTVSIRLEMMEYATDSPPSPMLTLQRSCPVSPLRRRTIPFDRTMKSFPVGVGQHTALEDPGASSGPATSLAVFHLTAPVPRDTDSTDPSSDMTMASADPQVSPPVAHCEDMMTRAHRRTYATSQQLLIPSNDASNLSDNVHQSRARPASSG